MSQSEAARHAHQYSELFHIVDGDGQFRIEDSLYPVKANQLVVNPNVIHTEVSYEAHPLEYIVLGIAHLELSLAFYQLLYEALTIAHWLFA